MKKQVPVPEADFGAVGSVLNAINQRAMGRQCLAEPQLARCLVERGEVGKGAANVDRNSQTTIRLSFGHRTCLVSSCSLGRARRV